MYKSTLFYQFLPSRLLYLRRITFVLVLSFSGAGPLQAQSIYFPPADGVWESVDPVSVGWSKAAHEQEQKITLLHLLSMTSGLSTEMEYETTAGSKWLYNTPAYLNPSYGYLWWLNGQEFSLNAGARAARTDGSVIPSAPDDLVAMQGAQDRKLYIVPSLNLVIARMGSTGTRDGQDFNDAFWEVLMKARIE